MPDKNHPQISFEVGAQLSFAIHEAMSRLLSLHKPFLEPLGLTFPQFIVMIALYREEPRTVGALCAELGMDNGTLTPMLKRFASVGLVTRERDTEDERRVLIGLTAKGEALRAEVGAVPGKIEATCDLTQEEMIALTNGLNKFAQPSGDSRTKQVKPQA